MSRFRRSGVQAFRRSGVLPVGAGCVRLRRRRRRGGFTLIEMIVATILLVLGVVATLSCVSSATQATSIASEYTTAALLAQQQLAATEANLSQLSGGTQSGDFGQSYPGYSWEMTTETTDFANLVRLTLTISWHDGLIQRSAQFVTYEQVPQQTTGTTNAG